MQETRNNCLGQKYIAQPFVRRKQVSTSAKTLLLHFGTHAYMFLPDEGSCYVFLTRNSWCEFLASYGVIILSVIQSIIYQEDTINVGY